MLNGTVAWLTFLYLFFYRCRRLEEFKVNFVASYGKFRPSFVCKLLDQNFISGKSLIWSWAFIDPISWLFPLWMDWLAKTWLSQVICVRRGFMKWWHLIFPMFLVSVSSQLILLFTWIFYQSIRLWRRNAYFWDHWIGHGVYLLIDKKVGSRLRDIGEIKNVIVIVSVTKRVLIGPCIVKM